jgi:hypothetical protein
MRSTLTLFEVLLCSGALRGVLCNFCMPSSTFMPVSEALRHSTEGIRMYALSSICPAKMCGDEQ